MNPAIIAALIGGGSMLGNTLLNKFIPGGDSGAGSMGMDTPNLGQTAMSMNPMSISPSVLYPKKLPLIQQQNGSLLGNSLFNLWGRR